MPFGYQRLETHPQMSAHARQLVEDQLDMQLADVHAMLRMPLPDVPGLASGCNFAAVQVLLSVASGVSATLFCHGALDERNNRGNLFIDMLVEHYPWNQERDVVGRIYGSEASKLLYYVFRNPLAHVLGIVDKKQTVNNLTIAIQKNPMEENEIVELELKQSQSVPWLFPTLISTDRNLSLHVASLYWGIRETVERVSRTRGARSFAFSQSKSAPQSGSAGSS
jgi:hypothetical protein